MFMSIVLLGLIATMIGWCVGIIVFGFLCDTKYQEYKAQWERTSKCAEELRIASDAYYQAAKEYYDQAHEYKIQAEAVLNNVTQFKWES